MMRERDGSAAFLTAEGRSVAVEALRAAFSPAEWHERAECRRLGLPMELFFPEKPHLVPAEARRACDACPVRIPCLEHALVAEEGGVWGGESERARRSYQRAGFDPVTGLAEAAAPVRPLAS